MIPSSILNLFFFLSMYVYLAHSLYELRAALYNEDAQMFYMPKNWSQLHH